MYRSLYNLKNYDNERVILSARHFLSPVPILSKTEMSNIRKNSGTATNTVVENFSNYAERNNVDPRVWGAAGWKFLYSVASSYPENPSKYDKLKMRKFLESLAYALPCERCRHNFYNEYKSLCNYSLRGPKELGQWFEKVEEKIRKRNTYVNSKNENTNSCKACSFPQKEREVSNCKMCG